MSLLLLNVLTCMTRHLPARRYYRRGFANYALQYDWPAELREGLPPRLQSLLGTAEDALSLEDGPKSSVGAVVAKL